MKNILLMIVCLVSLSVYSQKTIRVKCYNFLTGQYEKVKFVSQDCEKDPQDRDCFCDVKDENGNAMYPGTAYFDNGLIISSEWYHGKFCGRVKMYNPTYVCAGEYGVTTLGAAVDGRFRTECNSLIIMNSYLKTSKGNVKFLWGPYGNGGFVYRKTFEGYDMNGRKVCNLYLDNGKWYEGTYNNIGRELSSIVGIMAGVGVGVAALAAMSYTVTASRIFILIIIW